VLIARVRRAGRRRAVQRIEVTRSVPRA
jgi:acyl-coenzyme A thioesterase PaaI-like protein